MAVRPFLHLNNSIYKCILTTVEFKPKSQMTMAYNQLRFFRKYRGRTNYTSEIRIPKIVKSFSFTLMFSGATFIGAAIWNYETNRSKTYDRYNHYRQMAMHKMGWREQNKNTWWSQLSDHEKVFVTICLLNVLVYLAWKVPRYRTTMEKYFSCGIVSPNVCLPMLLSSFSHYSFVHLAFNMYALYNFSSFAVPALGKEQFVALYLSGGVVSSFTSNLYKTMLGLTRPSLGASGSLMAVVGYICTKYPHLHLHIIFLPTHELLAGTAANVMLLFDAIGMICRWQFLDHAAHFGGMLFGMFWCMWASTNIWGRRESILTYWHSIRESSKPR